MLFEKLVSALDAKITAESNSDKAELVKAKAKLPIYSFVGKQNIKQLMILDETKEGSYDNNINREDLPYS